MEGSCLHSRVLALCHQRQVLVGGVGPTEAGLDSDVLGSDPGSATSWPCSPGQVIPPLQLHHVYFGGGLKFPRPSPLPPFAMKTE